MQKDRPEFLGALILVRPAGSSAGRSTRRIAFLCDLSTFPSGLGGAWALERVRNRGELCGRKRSMATRCESIELEVSNADTLHLFNRMTGLEEFVAKCIAASSKDCRFVPG